MRGLPASLAWIAAMLASMPAHATAGIECRALDASGATLDIILGIGTVPAPLWARITWADERWTTFEGEEGTLLAVAQSFNEEDRMAIDLVDTNAMEKAASIRIFRVEENRRPHQIGYLHMVGRAVIPISCEGP